MGQVVKIESKELLNSMSNKFGEYVTQLTGEIDSLKTTLSSVENYEDINLTGAATVIISNLSNIVTDMGMISRNIQSYVNGIIENDVYDLDVDSELVNNNGLVGVGPSVEEEETNKDVSPLPSYPASPNPKPSASSVPKPQPKPTGSAPSNNGGNGTNGAVQEEVKNENLGGGSNVVQTPVVNQNTSSNQVSSNNQLSTGNSAENLNNNISGDSVVEEPIIENVVEDIPPVDNTVLVGNVSSGNNEPMTNVSSDKGIPLGGILGAGAAIAAVGVGAVGGAKVIKKMKENQEIDDEDEE